MATTYTAIDASRIDQDSPIDEPLMRNLRDNPIALAEGAAGAPRINGRAIRPFIGGLESTGGVLDVTGLENYGGIYWDGRRSMGVGAGGTVQIQLSDDGGTTWQAATTLANDFSGTSDRINGHVDFLSGAYVSIFDTTGYGTGTIALPPGTVNAVRFSMSADTNPNLRFMVSAGGIFDDS